MANPSHVEIDTTRLHQILATYSDDMPKGYDMLLDFIRSTSSDFSLKTMEETRKNLNCYNADESFGSILNH